jgi:hypothetical protein
MKIMKDCHLNLIGCYKHHLNHLTSFTAFFFFIINLIKGLNFKENTYIFSNFAKFTFLTYFFQLNQLATKVFT